VRWRCTAERGAKDGANLNKISVGQKGFRRESRKRMNPLTQNFRVSWFTRYTF
jgi:hypothetical protein